MVDHFTPLALRVRGKDVQCYAYEDIELCISGNLPNSNFLSTHSLFVVVLLLLY